jgi:PAS domain S-box-containing protein
MMTKILAALNKLFSMPASSAQVMRRDQWTRDIARLMLIVSAIATAVILVGVFTGDFTFPDTVPIYIILGASAAAYLGVRHNGWRWARFLPVSVSLLMGFYLSYLSDFKTTGLFYALAILLSGMLFNTRSSWLVTAISILGYTLLGAGFNLTAMYYNSTAIITTLFLLVGITFFLVYFENSLVRVISDLARGNEELEKEIKRRLQAEAASKKQGSLYVRLAENTSDLVSEMALDGTIKYISPSFLPAMGYTPKMLVGRSVFELVHPDDLQKAIDAQNEVSESRQPDRIRLRIRHNEGHYLHMEVTGTPLVDENGALDGFILSNHDITQQVIAEETLKDSEKQFRNIIEATPLGIHMYTLDQDNELVFSGYNPAADSILGFDHAPMIGKKILEVFPSHSGTEIPDAYRSVALNGGIWNPNQMVYQDEKTEGVFEVLAFQYAPGKMVAMFENITSKLAAEEALRSSQEIFATAFLTSPDAININRLSDGVYININQGFTNITGFTEDEVIGLSSLELNIWADPADRELLVKGLLENGEVNNLEAAFRFKDGSVKTGLMSARVIEVDQEPCILSITRDISDRKKAEIDLNEAHRQLEEAYTATLQGWVRALEIREYDTADHSRRVVELTIAMAKRMGISGEEIVHIQRGALLHDIGKIGVPDRILLKPGALSEEEWIIMRYHPVYARNLLKEIAYLVPAIDIPYCHHERWDGDGYPRGISGGAIPLAARIFSVIDVYDALLANRPYRPAWSQDDVKKYLITHKGKQFDPQVVDEFLAFLEEK